jgi:hypothetical protein
VSDALDAAAVFRANARARFLRAAAMRASFDARCSAKLSLWSWAEAALAVANGDLVVLKHINDGFALGLLVRFLGFAPPAGPHEPFDSHVVREQATCANGEGGASRSPASTGSDAGTATRGEP